MSRKTKEKIMEIYDKLYSTYGPQGWWPLIHHKSTNPTKSGSVRGYHPQNYDLPENREQVFEILVGAILTQNTAWTSAENALCNLYELDALNPQRMLNLVNEALKEAIKPAGFLNQKSVYLKQISNFFLSLQGRTPQREELLKVKGVGNETADSILLYAFKQPEFVVDAYTKRIFSHLGLIDERATYHQIKELFESNLPRDLTIYQEYHALIVEHAKRYYSRKPYGVNDPIML
jgi:endonuclease III related protein